MRGPETLLEGMVESFIAPIGTFNFHFHIDFWNP
jgi:hypothetical protein